jgi:hypothetical protein
MQEILSLMQLEGYSNFITYQLSSTAAAQQQQHSRDYWHPCRCEPFTPPALYEDCTIFPLGSQNVSTAFHEANANSVKRFQTLNGVSAEGMSHLTAQEVCYLGDY